MKNEQIRCELVNTVPPRSTIIHVENPNKQQRTLGKLVARQNEEVYEIKYKLSGNMLTTKTDKELLIFHSDETIKVK